MGPPIFSRIKFLCKIKIVTDRLYPWRFPIIDALEGNVKVRDGTERWSDLRCLNMASRVGLGRWRGIGEEDLPSDDPVVGFSAHTACRKSVNSCRGAWLLDTVYEGEAHGCELRESKEKLLKLCIQLHAVTWPHSHLACLPRGQLVAQPLIRTAIRYTT